MSWISGLSSRAIGKWLEEDRPTLDRDRCFNRKQRKITCTTCTETCEHGVYAGKEPDWTLCVNCGLCVAACPTRAIRPSSANLRAMLEVAESASEDVGFACERGGRTADMTVRCLAAVPWEMLACIALDHRVYLDVTPCAECPDERAQTLLAKSLASLQRFLGEEFYAEHVRLEAVPEHAGALSRREAFTSMFKRGKRLAANLIPDDGEGTTIDGGIYERLLEAKLAALAAKNAGNTEAGSGDNEAAGEDGETRAQDNEATGAEPGEPGLAAAPAPHLFTLDTLRISTDCWTCTVCEKLCPLGAIVVDDSDDDPGTRYLHHKPIRCTQCGLCQRVCPEQAILGWREIATDDPVGWRTTVVEVARCEKCGIPIHPGPEVSLCPSCQRPTGLAGAAARRLLGNPKT